MKHFSGDLKFLANAASIALARPGMAMAEAPAPAESAAHINFRRDTGFFIGFSFKNPVNKSKVGMSSWLFLTHPLFPSLFRHPDLCSAQAGDP
jgi:hypothetical protein